MAAAIGRARYALQPHSLSSPNWAAAGGGRLLPVPVDFPQMPMEKLADQLPTTRVKERRAAVRRRRSSASSTARAIPSGVWKWVLRSLIDRTGLVSFISTIVHYKALLLPHAKTQSRQGRKEDWLSDATVLATGEDQMCSR